MFNETKKYVINLKKRPKRLELIKKEFEYIGFDDVEVFEGIDLNSHVGCALSHLEIVKKAIENDLENVIVFEDDIIFMPYAKSLLSDIEKLVENNYFGTLNLNPSVHRPLLQSKLSDLLIDITNKPPKQENHRGVFGTGFMVYNKSVFQDMLKYDTMIAIDEFLENEIYPKYQSYTSILPTSGQRNDQSDVAGIFFNSFYTQTYNWNLYCPKKIPHNFLDMNYVLENRNVLTEDYKIYLNQ